ncbi:fibroblast growth factor 5 isoform X2 [Parus major]|uniref:fibroblast growth factor 5 isoform X2 n=1 Tax=Parus major TaxID=9157 RepID=UPI0014441ECE|nr:fibroblast growth factor 5 isoform X2 [Parus major]XP_033369683.1 fibroblast growth factor 5 isoform X2 [Parus major]XP_033369684.1 fibroblast growth factor 5 isoform X2 [Parus major]
MPRCPRGNPPGARWPCFPQLCRGRKSCANTTGEFRKSCGFSSSSRIRIWNQHGCVTQEEVGILEIFAVSQGIVGIRGVFSNKFLAMSKKGKLHASARFTVDCHFRERFQENSYNTYASAVHRSPRSGRQWYVALNKRGKAKRGCSPRARPQHVSTHFLPRFWQPQPPELAFTVALPEKKPPPPKPKPAPSPPRKNPGPVKYRLKFRFG